MNRLVSIIIATFNREAFILETLKSIRFQNYSNFECLIIDDKSIDNTAQVVLDYIKDDHRFQYYRRPSEITRGANSCRNYGFNLSKGEYVKFFDSDDLMLPTHLETLVSELESKKLDFVVGDCRNFDENGLRERPYTIDRANATISAKNFALHQVAWITNDLLLKREFASHLKFNEQIRDVANEYQYNIKLLCLTTNGKLVNEVLTYRRLHDASMTSALHRNKIKFTQHIAELKLFTEEYVDGVASKELHRWLLSGCIQLNFDLACSKVYPDYTFKTFYRLLNSFGLFKALLYPFAICTGYSFRKGYNIIKYIRS